MDYPKINGNRYSFASVELSIAGQRITGVKEINYSDSVERGMVRGNHAIALGRTRGDYDTEGSLTLFKEEAEDLLTQLGDGYYETFFDVVVTYAEENAATVTDRLVGCRFKKIDNNSSQGTDGLEMPMELDVTYIERNGRKPFRRMPGGGN